MGDLYRKLTTLWHLISLWLNCCHKNNFVEELKNKQIVATQMHFSSLIYIFGYTIHFYPAIFKYPMCIYIFFFLGQNVKYVPRSYLQTCHSQPDWKKIRHICFSSLWVIFNTYSQSTFMILKVGGNPLRCKIWLASVICNITAFLSFPSLGSCLYDFL